MTTDTNTLISFNLKNQIFAFDSLMVRNILEYTSATKVPNTKEYVLGVVNLHGNIVPVIDMRHIMGMGKMEQSKDTTIIIVSPEDNIESQFGVVVDMVSEVFEVAAEDIEDSAYQEGMGVIDHFEGAIKRDKDFIQIINLLNLLSYIQ